MIFYQKDASFHILKNGHVLLKKSKNVQLLAQVTDDGRDGLVPITIAEKRKKKE